MENTNNDVNPKFVKNIEAKFAAQKLALTGENTDMTMLERVGARELAKINVLAANETDGAKQELYQRAASFVKDAVQMSGLPDPARGSANRDWTNDVAEQKRIFESKDFSALKGKCDSDLKHLNLKFGAYGGLLSGENLGGTDLIEDILTAGLVKKESGDETVDYNLLSVIGSVKEVGAQLQGTLDPINSAIMENGPVYKKLGGELGDVTSKKGNDLAQAISTFSLIAQSSAGAVEIARERGLRNKVPMKEGEAMLNQAIDNELIGILSKNIEKFVHEGRATLPGCEYIKVRLRYIYGKGAYAIDGAARGSGEGMDIQFSVGVIARDGGEAGLNAWGNFGSELSLSNFSSTGGFENVKDAIDSAYQLAVANAHEKTVTREALMKTPKGRALAESISDVQLAPTPIVKKVVKAKYKNDPMATDIEGLVQKVENLSKESLEQKDGESKAKMNIVYAFSMRDRRLFIDSDGRNIDQAKVRTQGGYYTAAASSDHTRMPDSRYEAIIWNGGFEEVLDEGNNGLHKTFRDFVLDGTKETAGLVNAGAFPEELADGSGELRVYERDGKLYTDGTIVPTGRAPDKEMKHNVLVKPSALALMQHEISLVNGHGAESDRFDGSANNAAGYSVVGNFYTNKIGKKIASDKITAGFRTLDEYDEEGTPGGEFITAEKGVLKTVMNDRERAYKFGLLPNASARATEASKRHLIRMNHTFIRDGDTSPEEMIEMMGDGYILENNQTPAITSGRANGLFEMKKTSVVRKGRIVYDEKTDAPKVYRCAGVMADAMDFWGKDLQAVSNDGVTVTTPNCGKGEGNEMQAIDTWHYQPSLLSKAILTQGGDGGVAPRSYDAVKDSIVGYAKSFGMTGRA